MVVLEGEWTTLGRERKTGLESGCGLAQSASASERSLDEAAKADDLPVAGVIDKLDGSLLTGLEAHGGARGDVQPHASSRSPIEVESAVGLGKVVVRTDLNGAVSAVLDHGDERASTRIDRVVRAVGQQFTGNHGAP
jgi:hypothetical protein